MANIIAIIPGQSKNIIVVAAHYDTKHFEGIEFVGANDGASGPAVLLELAQRVQPGVLKSEVWLVFFDGEEAFAKWSDTDSLYGSKYFVRRLQEENRMGMVKAMLLLDMVGDSHLRLESEMNSTRRLREIVWEQARLLGHEEHFAGGAAWIDDDHTPFLKKGIPSLCIIDFHYGPGSRSNEFWHTPHDTLDKVSPESLQIVGEVIAASLPEIAAFANSGR
jgi:Zn-dependent M28 family amino/carboxypeptidase